MVKIDEAGDNDNRRKMKNDGHVVGGGCAVVLLVICTFL
jgi:hypothetical protein